MKGKGRGRKDEIKRRRFYNFGIIARHISLHIG